MRTDGVGRRESAGGGAWGPAAALLLASFLWGATFALVKGALSDAEALSFLALRFAVALAALALGAGLAPRRGFLRGARAGEWAMGAAAGAALYGGFLFQTEGLRHTTAGNSAFITGLCVIIVPFMLWLGGRRPGRCNVAGAAVALAGLYLLSGADLAAGGWGDALTLVCALSFALHILCLGVFGRRMGTPRLFAIQLIAAASLAAAAALLWGGPVRWTGRVVAALLITGVLATTLAFFLQTWAQRRLAPERASLWLLTEPLFALGFGYALLGEAPAPVPLAGAIVILFGVAVSEAGATLAGGMRAALSPVRISAVSAGAESAGPLETERAEA